MLGLLYNSKFAFIKRAVPITSNERREIRYKNRKTKRLAQAQKASEKSFQDVFSFGNLLRAGRKSCNGVRWKTSTINFETFLLKNSYETYSALRNGKRKFKGFHSFVTVEHGKARDIDALPIADRAAQKCLCNNILTDVYMRSFIYDNAASLPQRGMDFALKRLKQHLRQHYRKYGTEGGIYQFDFRGYFASLPHSVIKERLRQKITNDDIFKLTASYVDDFERRRTATGDRRGVGLGSEISQSIALDYASPIDHYIKDKLGIKGYGRYMDDGYVISDSLDELKVIKAELYKLCSELGLCMSDKKNIITPFRHHSFRFLKMRVTLSDTGKIAIRLSRTSIKAIRRKLDIFRRWVSQKRMSIEDVCASYQSWRAHAKRCNSYNTLCSMDKRFVNLFKAELNGKQKAFPCTLKAIKTPLGWAYVQRKGR